MDEKDADKMIKEWKDIFNGTATNVSTHSINTGPSIYKTHMNTDDFYIPTYVDPIVHIENLIKITGAENTIKSTCKQAGMTKSETNEYYEKFICELVQRLISDGIIDTIKEKTQETVTKITEDAVLDKLKTSEDRKKGSNQLYTSPWTNVWPKSSMSNKPFSGDE